MWVLALSLVVLGIVCHFADKWMRKTGRLKDTPPEKAHNADDTECCGEHDVCEKETLLRMDDDIVYYDDEELDLYKGIPASQYTDEAIREFEDVFYTLQEKDVAGWVRSLQLRGIELPDGIKDEVLMIIRERRFQTNRQ